MCHLHLIYYARDDSNISTCRITSIGENGLASDPMTLCAQEFDDRGYVLHICQTSVQCTALMKGDRFW